MRALQWPPVASRGHASHAGKCAALLGEGQCMRYHTLDCMQAPKWPPMASRGHAPHACKRAALLGEGQCRR